MSVEESKFIKINILNLNRANKFATNDAFNFENNAQHKSILIIFLREKFDSKPFLPLHLVLFYCCHFNFSGTSGFVECG